MFRNLGAKSLAAIFALMFSHSAPRAGVFEIIALPDTENYTDHAAGFPGIVAAQTQWVANNRAAENIVFVTQLGDLIHHDPTNEMPEATSAIGILDQPGQQVPYSVSAGNHELESTTSRTLVTQNFGPDRYQGYSWYKGSYNNFNHYQVFSAGGYEFLHINLQKELPRTAYDPNVLAWAQGVINANLGKPTIISTHDYLTSDTTRSGIAGTAIWTNLVKNNPQVFLTLNGHTRPTTSAYPSGGTIGAARMLSTDTANKKVLQVLSDFEDYTTTPAADPNDPRGVPSGPANAGYLRKIIFDTDNKKLTVKTFSPTYTDKPWITDSYHQFSYDMAFLPQAPGSTFSPIFVADAPICTGAGYAQDFDAAPGPAGTAPPLGWTVWQIAGVGSTFTNASPIQSAHIATATSANQTLLVVNDPPSGTWGGQAANAPNGTGRVLATNPGNNAAGVIQMKVTNGVGAPVTSLEVHYDLAMLWSHANDDGSELPGYALFWSKTGSTTAADWTKLGEDRTVGTKAWNIVLPTPLAAGGDLYLRWADDNVLGPSGEGVAENVWAVDNLRLTMTAIPTPGTVFWNGGAVGDPRWTTAANWGGQTPLPGHQLTFGLPTGGGGTGNSNDFAAGTRFDGITFTGDAPAYDVQGNAIQLAGPVQNQSGNDQTISLDMELVGGAVAFDDGGKTLTLSGTLSGEGSLVKSGSGTLVLGGLNTYTGDTVVEGGTLVLNHEDGVPDGGHLIIHGGRVVLRPGLPGAVRLSGLHIGPGMAAPVPEPGTLALVAAAAAALLAFAWRRRTIG